MLTNTRKVAYQKSIDHIKSLGLVVLGMVGESGCGKSTVSAILKNNPPQPLFGSGERVKDVVEMSFAEPLKKLVAAGFNFTHEQVTDPVLKNTVVPKWEVTPRYLLQKFGTEICRNILPKVCPKLNLMNTLWIENIRHELGTLNPQTIVVIADVRFPDEHKFLKSIGGYLVRVKRDMTKITDVGLKGDAKKHASEQYAHTITCDVTLNNNRSLSHLKAKVLSTMNPIIKREFDQYSKYGLDLIKMEYGGV